jgi:uncharacterized membrane protein
MIWAKVLGVIGGLLGSLAGIVLFWDYILFGVDDVARDIPLIIGLSFVSLGFGVAGILASLYNSRRPALYGTLQMVAGTAGVTFAIIVLNWGKLNFWWFAAVLLIIAGALTFLHNPGEERGVSRLETRKS